ncbi:MAG: acyl-CoA dehydratase activase-related protein [Chloroflexota bacterium]
MVRIGIPRALLYYQYYPMWRTFFEALGAEVVVSPPTTQAALSAGSARVVIDTCLPVKVYCGHVTTLVDSCDYLFIPVVRSVKRRVYNCAKFLGLPDMVRAVIPGAPPILDIEIDLNRGKGRLYRAIYRLGRHLTWHPGRVRQAALAAVAAHQGYRQLMAGRELMAPAAIACLNGDDQPAPPASSLATIALVGHPYLLYDEHLNHRLIHRLQQAGIRVLTPEMATSGELQAATDRLVGGDYWTYEGEVVGAGEHYLTRGVDGVIGLMAFGCGPDSVMMDMVRRRAASLGAGAFMCLTLEEHSAEAGILTRLEAFLDMILRKKRQGVATCV